MRNDNNEDRRRMVYSKILTYEYSWNCFVDSSFLFKKNTFILHNGMKYPSNTH